MKTHTRKLGCPQRQHGFIFNAHVYKTHCQSMANCPTFEEQQHEIQIETLDNSYYLPDVPTGEAVSKKIKWQANPSSENAS